MNIASTPLGTASIDCELLHELAVPGLRIGFKFRWTALGGGVATEAKITQQARMTITPDLPLPFDAQAAAKIGGLVIVISGASCRHAHFRTGRLLKFGAVTWPTRSIALAARFR